MAETEKPAALPKDVAAKYDMAVIPVGTYDLVGFGEVDFTTISLATAARIAKKFPYLVEKDAPAQETKAVGPAK